MLMKKLVTLILVLAGIVNTASADDSYVVAGDESFFGSNWNTTDVNNKMISAGDGIYSITYTDKLACSFEFKVVKNGSWDTAYPRFNYKVTLSAGYSNVTISIDTNDDKNTVTCVVVPSKFTAIYHSVEANKWKVGKSLTYNPTTETHSISLSLNPTEVDYFALSDEKLTEGDDYTSWNRVIRPVSYGNYHMSLQYSSGNTTYTNNEHVWQVIDNATYSFAYYPGTSSFDCNAEATGSISAAGWATYSTGGYEGSNGYTISGDDVQAYYVSASADGKATLTAIASESVIPNKAGIMLNGSGTFTVRTVKGDAIDLSTNMLKGSGSYTFDITGEYYGDSYTGYVLGGSGETLGFYRVDNTNESARTVKPHKAFLYVSNGTEAHSFDFISLDSETTGIETVKATQKMNGEFFNLAGQRVAQPAKGLYIVNGKKVIMK